MILNINCKTGMQLFLADNSVDAIVCDPPYELTSARPGGRSEATRGAVMGGFMGMQWDGTGIAYDVGMWAEALRVLKPGGHLLAFGGSRTAHRMVCAIEDAGFDIRDQIMWIYGSGMPKSFNMKREAGKSICGCATGTLPYTHENPEPKTECDVRPVRNANVPSPEYPGEERGQILQPGMSQQSAHGAMLRSEPCQSSIWGSERIVERRRDAVQTQGQLQGHPVHSGVGEIATDGTSGRLHHGAPGGDGAVVRLPADADGSGAPRRPRSDEQPAQQSGTVADEQLTQTLGAWPLCTGCGLPMVPSGLGTALKPAHEPVCVARKPLAKGLTVAANVLAHGTGAINIDGCRVNTNGEKTGGSGAAKKGTTALGDFAGNGGNETSTLGRWPANLIHDGSDEVLAGFPAQAGAAAPVRGTESSAASTGNVTGERARVAGAFHNDTGSAARFFYCAKASPAERNQGAGNNHPTVKPIALMRYLVRLVTPPGGLVLDPFTGSGTTAVAAKLEGAQFMGFELSAEYAAIATARYEAAA